MRRRWIQTTFWRVSGQLNSNHRSVKVNKDLAIIRAVKKQAAAGKAEPARAATRHGGATRSYVSIAAQDSEE
jgi:hypothetical protein